MRGLHALFIYRFTLVFFKKDKLMRAYGYFQITLIMVAALTLPVITALVNWLGGIYDSVWSYIVAYYYNWLVFGLIGTLFGVITGWVGAVSVYNETRQTNRADPFDWSSVQAKLKAKEETKLGVYSAIFVYIVSGLLFLVGYFLLGESLDSTLAGTLNIAAILAWPVFIVGVLTLVPPLLVDIIFGNFLSSLLRRLSNHS